MFNTNLALKVCSQLLSDTRSPRSLFYSTVPTGLFAYVPAHTKHQFGISCRDEGDNNNNDDNNSGDDDDNDCHVVGNLGTTLVGRRSIRFAGCDSRPSLAHSPLVFAVVNTHAHAAAEQQQRQQQSDSSVS